MRNNPRTDSVALAQLKSLMVTDDETRSILQDSLDRAKKHVRIVVGEVSLNDPISKCLPKSVRTPTRDGTGLWRGRQWTPLLKLSTLRFSGFSSGKTQGCRAKGPFPVA